MGKTVNTTSTSFRLPDLTQEQLKGLGEKWGMTHTKVLILCVDRIWTQVMDSKRETSSISNKGSKKE